MHKIFLSVFPIFSLVISSITGLPAQLAANSSAQPTAVQNALTVLTHYPIETDLRSLDSLADTLSSSLDSLDGANTLIQISQNIKDVPGAWPGLIMVLNGVTPGLGTSMNDLDTNIRKMIAIKNDLDDLKDLDQLADLIATFTSTPTDSNLISLKNEINEQIFSLTSLQSTLSNQFLDVYTILQNIENIRSAISQKAKELIVINGVTQNISKLNATLGIILNLVRTSSTKLQGLLNPLNRVVGVINAIRNDSAQVSIQTITGNNSASITNNPSKRPYYYPLAECNGSYLRIGDYVTVNTGSGSQGIRSTPDTHPSNNIIARVPEGGGMTIVGGPKCNYGWVLWQVNTDSGTYGWTPESNGTIQWLVTPLIYLNNPKPRSWYHPLTGCAGSYLMVGDHVTVIYGTGPQTIRSTTDVSNDANNRIGQIPEGAGMTIISGPKCSSGWILWEVVTDSGLQGWTAEGDTIQEWLQLQSVVD
jgi:hypothetical protein